MTNTNQQEQLYSRQDVINAWNSAYGGDRYLSGEDYVDDLLPSPPVEDGKQGGEVQEFLEYINNARNKFTAFIGSYEWRNDLRTSVDDILIAYDQMADRLKSQPSTTVQDGWVKDKK